MAFWDNTAFWNTNRRENPAMTKNIDVQKHLQRVYLCLCTSLAAAAVGVALHFLLNIGGLLTCFGCLASIVWLVSVPSYPFNERKRLGLLLTAAILKGATVGPVIDAVSEIGPGIPITALVGTSLAFACFSGSAVLAKRRQYLFLGGILSSAISVLLWIQIASAFFSRSLSFYMLETYFGLFIFIGYIIYDTQMIIERAEGGDLDYIKHSLDLFTDFVAVFVRLLVIMARNSEARKEERRKKRT